MQTPSSLYVVPAGLMNQSLTIIKLPSQQKARARVVVLSGFLEPMGILRAESVENAGRRLYAGPLCSANMVCVRLGARAVSSARVMARVCRVGRV